MKAQQQPKNYFPVGYTYNEGGKIRTWATVTTGKDEASALAKFRRTYRQLLSVWIIRQPKEGE